jgi:hypothetical protein
LFDQSGTTNCSSAACNLVQATNAQRPVFTTSCIGITGGNQTCATQLGYYMTPAMPIAAQRLPCRIWSIVPANWNSKNTHTAGCNSADNNYYLGQYVNTGGFDIWVGTADGHIGTMNGGTWYAFQGIADCIVGPLREWNQSRIAGN